MTNYLHGAHHARVFLTINKGQVKAVIGWRRHYQKRLREAVELRSLDDWRNLVRHLAREIRCNTSVQTDEELAERFTIQKSSSIDFPEEHTSDQQVIALARQLA